MTDKYAKLREAAEKATPGPWKHATYMSGTQNVEYPGSKGITFSDQVIAADASDICYESDAQPLPFINISHRSEDKGSEVDPQRSLNAAYIAAANPQAVLALLDERDEMSRREDDAVSAYERALARATALEADLAAEKARADAAEAERDKLREGETRLSLLLNENAREAVATISTLTAERDALKRERDEAERDFHEARSVRMETGKLLTNTRIRAEKAERERDEARERETAAREFVKRHPALSLIDIAEFEAFLKVPAAIGSALSDANAAEREV